MMGLIPVVNFSRLNINKCEEEVTSDDVRLLTSQLRDAFCNVGFLRLTNTGIDEEEVTDLWKTMDKFFSLPKDVKRKYSRINGVPWGWIGPMGECLDPQSPADYKEFLEVAPEYPEDRWPEVAGIKEKVKRFYGRCHVLGQRLLHLLGHALNLKDPAYFLKSHHTQFATPISNGSSLRILHYPPIHELEPGQLRCGSHTDWGTFTLLFQDQVGGLQFLPPSSKDWVDATSIPGTVMVNVGDMLQRWTSDQFISARHRVTNSADPSTSRRSIAFFVQPDRDFPIKSLTGNKYDAITYREYETMKNNEVLY